MTSPLTEVLLHDYYSKTNIFSKEFEHKMSQRYPEIYVQAIKTNQVFFKENRIDFIVEEILLPEKLEVHQKCWRLFYDNELGLWNAIYHKLKVIKEGSYSFEAILFSVILYVEEKYQQADNREAKQSLGDEYSFFIELYLKEFDINQEQFDITKDKFNKAFLQKFFLHENLNLDTDISEIFQLIKRRKNLFDTFFDPYSFDENVYPNMVYQQLYFTTKPEGYYHWKVQGIRYPNLELIYYFKGISKVDYYIKEGLLPDHKLEKDKEARRECDIQRFSILSVLEDLEMEDYYYSKDLKINVNIVVSSLQTFAGVPTAVFTVNLALYVSPGM